MIKLVYDNNLRSNTIRLNALLQKVLGKADREMVLNCHRLIQKLTIFNIKLM